MEGAISQIKACFTLSAVEIGPFKTPAALESTWVAEHGGIGSIIDFEVIEQRAVTCMIGHIGDIPFHTRNDTSTIPKIRLISSNCIAACACDRTSTFHTKFIALYAIGLGGGTIDVVHCIPTDLIHRCIFIGCLWTSWITQSIGKVQLITKTACGAVICWKTSGAVGWASTDHHQQINYLCILVLAAIIIGAAKPATTTTATTSIDVKRQIGSIGIGPADSQSWVVMGFEWAGDDIVAAKEDYTLFIGIGLVIHGVIERIVVVGQLVSIEIYTKSDSDCIMCVSDWDWIDYVYNIDWAAWRNIALWKCKFKWCIPPQPYPTAYQWYILLVVLVV